MIGDDPSTSHVTEAQRWPALGAWEATIARHWICLSQGKSGNSHAGQLDKFWPQRARQARACDGSTEAPGANWSRRYWRWNHSLEAWDVEPKRWLKAPLLWKGDPVVLHTHIEMISLIYPSDFHSPAWNPSWDFRFKNLRPFLRSLACHSRPFLNWCWSCILALFSVDTWSALITLVCRTYAIFPSTSCSIFFWLFKIYLF